MISLQIAIEKFPIAGRFIIARGAKTEAAVVTVTLTDGRYVGRGECVPYARYGESVDGVVAAIEDARPFIERELDGPALQERMKPGAARNAVDCALWDLEAKRTGIRASVRAGVPNPRSAVTAYTISLDSPEKMAEAARKVASRALLKIKLGGADGDVERMIAVREAAPNAELIADANEGWTTENVLDHLNACAKARFALIEQPMPADKDEVLRTIPHPVPLCADESVHDRASLARLVGLYEAVNIKLDKTGGLTEALAMAAEAERLGFKIMIGCMVGTSLAMAPALMLAGRASFVDLDGPLLLARDREHGLKYEGSLVWPPEPSLWG